MARTPWPGRPVWRVALRDLKRDPTSSNPSRRALLACRHRRPSRRRWQRRRRARGWRSSRDRGARARVLYGDGGGEALRRGVTARRYGSREALRQWLRRGVVVCDEVYSFANSLCDPWLLLGSASCRHIIHVYGFNVTLQRYTAYVAPRTILAYATRSLSPRNHSLRISDACNAWYAAHLGTTRYV